MPQITDADVQRVKDLVKSRDIAAARKLLQSFQGERAARMLVQLNEKYPDLTPAPTIPLAPPLDANVDKAKQLIAKGRYSDAEKLLLSSEDPRADMLLARIKDARTDGGAIAAKPKSYIGGLLRMVVRSFFIIIACGVIAVFASSFSKQGEIALQRAEAEQKEEARQTFKLFCVILLTDVRPDATDEQIDGTCHNESIHITKTYTYAIEVCHESYRDEADKFIFCLFDKGVAFSDEFLEVTGPLD